ncbi:serine/threonine-protein kinase [Ruania alba]|uniref:non-specific serine/threonine protein kinase n=1 Tax=Ruania alba TaxID=648782 RepID=A0A1H5N415_9MICO|nr:serine/threonine-protein kinase [Ruania alba]SEE96246.1 Serine/threonine protein kinase [Ruania alba]
MNEDDAPVIPGFEYLRTIGHGGFSDVYLYRQQMPVRDVAIKVLRTESLTPEGRARFAAEANLMARLSGHTGIADVLSADVDADGDPYLVMEYCPGGSLGERYRTEPMSVAEVLELGVRIASALESAHRLGIVHRDVKPSNLLLTEYGVTVLGDFGISTIDETFPEATRARAEMYSGLDVEVEDSVGMSLPWAAPETVADPPISNMRSDRYSLGATLYSLLEGRSPHEAPDGPNGSAHLTGRIRSGFVARMQRTDVPASLEQALRTAMAYDPAERFDSMLELALALQDVQRELGLGVTGLEIPMSAGPLPTTVDPTPTVVPGAGAGSGAPGDGSGGPPGTGPAGGGTGANSAGPPGNDDPERAAIPASDLSDRAAQTWLPGAAGPPSSAAAPSEDDQRTNGQEQDGRGAEDSARAPDRAPMAAGFVPMVPLDAPVAAPGARTRTLGQAALIGAVAFVVLAVVVGGGLLVDWLSTPHFTGRAVDNLEVVETTAHAYDVTVPDGLDPPEGLQSRVLVAAAGTGEADTATVFISTDEGTWAEGDTLVLNPHEGESAGDLALVDVARLREALNLEPTEPIAPGLMVLTAAPQAYFVNVTPELGVSSSDSSLVVVSVVE